MEPQKDYEHPRKPTCFVTHIQINFSSFYASLPTSVYRSQQLELKEQILLNLVFQIVSRIAQSV
jgi:hypothetical protein